MLGSERLLQGYLLTPVASDDLDADSGADIHLVKMVRVGIVKHQRQDIAVVSPICSGSRAEKVSTNLL